MAMPLALFQSLFLGECVVVEGEGSGEWWCSGWQLDKWRSGINLCPPEAWPHCSIHLICVPSDNSTIATSQVNKFRINWAYINPDNHEVQNFSTILTSKTWRIDIPCDQQEWPAVFENAKHANPDFCIRQLSSGRLIGPCNAWSKLKSKQEVQEGRCGL